MDTDEDAARIVSQLSKNVADLQSSLEPLISTALSEQAQSLSPLEQAKLYTYVVYAIESVLFSYLRLNGVKATEHPVFRELTRVKQYFEKIKNVEKGPEQPRLQLDQAAAGRFIKQGLTIDEPTAEALKTSQPASSSSSNHKRKGDDSEAITVSPNDSKRRSDKADQKKPNRKKGKQ